MYSNINGKNLYILLIVVWMDDKSFIKQKNKCVTADCVEMKLLKKYIYLRVEFSMPILFLYKVF